MCECKSIRLCKNETLKYSSKQISLVCFLLLLFLFVVAAAWFVFCFFLFLLWIFNLFCYQYISSQCSHTHLVWYLSEMLCSLITNVHISFRLSSCSFLCPAWCKSVQIGRGKRTVLTSLFWRFLALEFIWTLHFERGKLRITQCHPYCVYLCMYVMYVMYVFIWVCVCMYVFYE